MKPLLTKIKFILPIFLFLNLSKLKSDNFNLENSFGENSEFLIESNKQRSDLKNSIFFAEGDVVITNTKKEFVAKSKKAIFYRLSGKIKLIGDVEVVTSDSNKINAGEILYFYKENKFEAISNQSQRVKTKFVFNDNEIPNQSK